MLCFHVDVDFIVEIWLYNESSLIKYDKYLVTWEQLRRAMQMIIKAFRLNEYENCG